MISCCLELFFHFFCSHAISWFNLTVTIPQPTPEQTPGQDQPFGPGGGELFEQFCLGGIGGGANQKYLLFDFAKYEEVRVISRAVCTNGGGLQDYVFSRENARICRRLIEEEKSVFEGMF